MMSIVRRVLGRASPNSPWISGKPVREELFSVERLEEHARSLAVAQPVTPRPTRGHPLSGRLADNGGVLLHAYRMIAKSTEAGRAITPAAEWLVDNYYLVEREIREIRSALPPGYYRQLPKLLDWSVRGIPAGVRRGLGLRRTHRQPFRRRDAVPLRARLPGGAAADHRRTLGGCHHAPDRAGRKPPASGRADHAQQRRATGGGRSRRPPAGCGRTRRRTGIGCARTSQRHERCPTHSPSSSCTGCAIRIPGSPPR